jgi:hypothetical protein
MVVTLNRSVYCPKDRQQLQALAAFYPQICVGYTRLVTIIAENLIPTPWSRTPSCWSLA